MQKNLLPIVLLILGIFIFSFPVGAQTIIWSEDFTYPDGTMIGDGVPPKWTVDITACTFDGDDNFEVRSNQMEGTDLDGEAVWRSQGIDISGYASVSISVDLSEVGDLEATDYIRVYYQIDGGAETLFDTNGDVSDDFDNLVASQANLSGNILIIVVRVLNNATTEFIRFDNVTVREGTQTLDHFSIAPIANQKVGVPFSTTVTAKDASDATVTSFTGTVDISDLSGNISPTTSGNFTAGVWTGNVTISSEYTSDQITVTNSSGTETGTSNQFDVVTGPAPGSVVINELMWMGSSLSSADEWIELRNTTSGDIDLSGWQLTKLSSGSEAFMLEIPAGNTIPANGYFLISNYDEANSQIAVTPDLVDASVSLANTQLQIKLYDGQWDGSGTLIDTADDGVGAPAAGDNTLKYSMSRETPPGDGTLALNWFTADLAIGWDVGATEKGTPGAANFASEPEIDVQRPAGTSISDGGSDNIGNQNVGAVNLTYTIDNSAGTDQLEVTAVTVSNLTNCSGFTVVTGLPLNIAAGAAADLQISFNVDAIGAFSFDMDISNNDADENPYDIAVSGSVADSDNDGITDVDEGVTDRDGDGIPNNQDYDPSGWIYNEDNGEIVTGGTISISPSTGVTIIEDGSNGYYQFTVSQGGDYTLSYTPPAGFNLSSTCTAQSGTLDPDPATDPNPYVVGAGSRDGTTNKMTNWDCGDNPYYWNFHLEVGDPLLINNNIPLKPQPTNIVLSAFTAKVSESGILLQWTTETEPDNAGFNIFRSQAESGEYLKINETLLPSQGNDTSGADYSYLDNPAQTGSYYYKLQSVSLTGDTSFYGPVSAILTSANMAQNIIPDNFSLSQNYPNPFNPETQINFALPEPASVALNIYDVNGHLVRTLVSGLQTTGTHLVSWDGRDNSGARVVSGVYFYYFKAIGVKQSFSQTKKMVLMK